MALSFSQLNLVQCNLERHLSNSNYLRMNETLSENFQFFVRPVAQCNCVN